MLQAMVCLVIGITPLAPGSIVPGAVVRAEPLVAPAAPSVHESRPAPLRSMVSGSGALFAAACGVGLSRRRGRHN